jgi:serine/threonine protein kinase
VGIFPETFSGRQFGDYLMTRRIGRGSFGQVYQGQHQPSRRQVAIKIIPSHVSRLPQVAQRFEIEARLTASIDHPCVIDIYEYGGLEDGSLYEVMEMLEGCDLAELLEKEQSFTPWEVLLFLQQICGGLQAAHNQGVVHRDLNPSNIYVVNRRPLKVKLLDFGIAKLLDSREVMGLTTNGAIMGTPPYLSPEQAKGDNEATSPRSDIYSLGIIIYQMLSGELPFAAECMGSLLYQHILDPAPPLRQRKPSVPSAVARVVHRCLKKDPADRPQSASEVYRQYRSALTREDPQWMGAPVARSIEFTDTELDISVHDLRPQRTDTELDISVHEPQDTVREKVVDHSVDQRPETADAPIFGVQRPASPSKTARIKGTTYRWLRALPWWLIAMTALFIVIAGVVKVVF